MDNQSFNECPICLNNARLPVATRCGHIFCWSCIKNWVQTKNKLECPICKNGIKLDEVIKLYTGDNKPNDNEKDDRPQQERVKPEYLNPNIFYRIANNFGFFGYTPNNIGLRPPDQKEVQRNRLSLIILILAIIFVIYVFNSS